MKKTVTTKAGPVIVGKTASQLNEPWYARRGTANCDVIANMKTKAEELKKQKRKCKN